MKRFLIFCTCVFIIFSGIKYGLKENPKEFSEVNYFTKVEGENITLYKDNNFKTFEIRGINLEGVKPGEFPVEDNISKEEYLKWLNEIYNMNVNTIRVKDLLTESFYEAFYEFNKDKEDPLYLIQGINYDEISLKDGKDIQDKDLSKNFKDYAKFVVDSIHGNKFNNTNKKLFGKYENDVSKYVIAYTIGLDWSVQDIIYTEIMNDSKEHKGEYFKTEEGASDFEVYLAKLADDVVSYESNRYGNQRLITFLSSIEYSMGKDSDVAHDKRYVDINNIKGTEKLKTGIFVSYNLYETYLSKLNEKDSIKDILQEINKKENNPVVITEYGASTSRIGAYYGDKTYLTEREQGERIVKLYREIKSSGCSGSTINEWQDAWYKTAWNTVDFTILDGNASWKDSTTYSQAYGILSFEPGEESRASYVDESIKEWKKEDRVNTSKKLEISAKSDSEYIYLMVRGINGFNINNKEIFIDLDTTKKSGSKVSSEHNLKFENEVDFLLDIKDKDNSKMLIHEYYNPQSFIKDKSKLKIRPDIIERTKNMDKFSKMMRYLRPKTYSERETLINEIEVEAGKLIYGNSNPSSKEYNSASDFYRGDNFVEVRIPYSLLNFMDPSQKKIQDDYYENFSFEPITIDEINIGATVKADKGNSIRLESNNYNLKSWTKPKYHERLKESYYIIKKEFSGKEGGN
ncbi:hypothetical protein J2Z53_002026 [Clostridium moniliforme]|uniref:Uncharacterized protein n=1 Tax=Clostridium moniliforme TaxID=39489 RepID=A0ABS4F2G8_9CLOT|nr:hypothetical protein [Clostridium moniliforme]MBP1890431.1 hypothetical protein [Clostridium moniliforme]